MAKTPRQRRFFDGNQPFPEHNAKYVNVPLEAEISDLMSAVRVIRNMRVSANISPSKKITQ
jgi:valyl-tRNA synthetase